MENMTNEEKVKRCAASNPLYRFFEENDFWNNCTATIEKTIWQGKESENSLCFSQSTNSKEQVEKLISIFRPQKEETFRNKFEEEVGGNGNEGRKIMTLHSSSLLSLLCFYNVTKDHPLTLSIPEVDGGKDIAFTESKFEVKNDLTYSYKGDHSKIENSNPSNMDVVLKSGQYTLFLESKFSEYLKNGLVAGIKNDVYTKIFEDLKDFLKENKLKCEDEDGKDTFKLRANSGNTKNYLAGIKQMISHFMAVCNYANTHSEKVILGTILYKFEPDIDNKLHFDNYVKLYGKLVDALNEIKGQKVPNLILLHAPLTYQEVFNKNFLDEKVAAYYKLSNK